MIRKIVYIDENKCNGCGLCIPNCAEGAIKIVDGKAKLISDNLCDGLGACLGHCPQDAIRIIEREAEEFDEKAVKAHQQESKKMGFGGCPGSQIRMFSEEESSDETYPDVQVKSQLRQWPIQLMLVPVSAPYLKNADLLVTSDCVPFAYANYHNDLLKGKKVVIGCPKLDDLNIYIEKLTKIIKNNSLSSITVAFMEVPCCYGIVYAVEKAVQASGKNIPVTRIQIGIDGTKSIQ
ncbi:MAG: 4Fe-4S binding protein [Clostridiaceae bacterium]|nr:4Fe-4S binding protein [Clostridiaceae bacterium]